MLVRSFTKKDQKLFFARDVLDTFPHVTDTDYWLKMAALTVVFSRL